MACEEIENRMADYLEQRLSPPERSVVELHLAGCGRCRALARQLEELDAALTAAIQAPALSSGFSARLRQRIQTEGAGSWEAQRAERQRQLQAEFEAGWAQLQRSWLRSIPWLDLLGWGALALLAGVAIWEFAPAWRALAAQHGIGRSAQDLALACVAAAVPLLFGLAVAFPRRARELWS